MLAKGWNDFSTPTRRHSCRSSSCANECLRCASVNRPFVLNCRRSLTRPTIGQPSCDWRRLSRRSSHACAVPLRRLMSRSASESSGSWSKTSWWGTTPSPFVTASQSHRAPHKTAVRRQVGQMIKVTFCVRGVTTAPCGVLLRRLAAHYPDDVIAGILNRQGRKTANGERFTANQVCGLRRYRNIPRYEPPADPPTGKVVPIRQAAQILGVNTSTVHRWLNDGFIAGEQVTPGAPWQIRITDELRARFVEQAPPGYLAMLETTLKLGVSRQTVLQRVKRGELEALLVTRGRRKGLRIKVVDDQPGLFHELRGIME